MEQTGTSPDAIAIERCDLLLFVATQQEYESLRDSATAVGLTFTSRPGRFAEYFDLGQVGHNRVYAVKTSVGPLSYGGSASRAIYCLTETGATGIVSVGMAFGVDRSNQKLGDVLVSSSLLPHDRRRVCSDSGLPRYNFGDVQPFASKRSLLQIFESERQRTTEFSVHIGAMLSGAAHLACRAYRDHLVQRCGRGEPVIGGEMEGIGLLSASETRNPLWILVKGIVDFGDEERDGDVKSARPLACGNAARFVLKALLNQVPAPQPPTTPAPRPQGNA